MSDGPGDLDARAASTWVSATGVAWALVPLLAAAAFVVDATSGHLAAAATAAGLVTPALGVMLLRRRTPGRR